RRMASTTSARRADRLLERPPVRLAGGAGRQCVVAEVARGAGVVSRALPVVRCPPAIRHPTASLEDRSSMGVRAALRFPSRWLVEIGVGRDAGIAPGSLQGTPPAAQPNSLPGPSA